MDILDVPAANEDTKKDIVAVAQSFLVIAEGMTIEDEQMLRVVNLEMKCNAAIMKGIEERRLEVVRSQEEAKRVATRVFVEALEKRKRADGYLRKACSDWNAKVREQARIAQEEANRQAREAAEKLRREAAAAQAKAEREARELRERAAAAEAEGRAAEAAKLTARAETKVENAESKAQTLELAATAMPTAVKIAAPALASGFSESAVYNAEVENFEKLVRFCLATPMFMNLIMVNQPELNKLAKSLKDRFAIDGAKLVKTTSSRVRS